MLVKLIVYICCSTLLCYWLRLHIHVHACTYLPAVARCCNQCSRPSDESACLLACWAVTLRCGWIRTPGTCLWRLFGCRSHFLRLRYFSALAEYHSSNNIGDFALLHSTWNGCGFAGFCAAFCDSLSQLWAVSILSMFTGRIAHFYKHKLKHRLK